MKDITIEIESPDEDLLPGENLCVLNFTHYQDSRELTFDPGGRVNLFLMRGVTQCAVELASGGVLIGDAWCCRKDKFDRREGERQALAKALRSRHVVALEKYDRRWIWRKYLEARPVLPERKAKRRTLANLERKLAKQRLADAVVTEVLR